MGISSEDSPDADLKVRRVVTGHKVTGHRVTGHSVTGHDAQYRAVVVSDEQVEASIKRPGQQACVIWATDQVPVDNLDPNQGPELAPSTVLEDGAVFRLVRYEPGRTGRMHRTRSLDYGVVIRGSIVLELDEGAEVTLNAGDFLVQRGTIHNWHNRTDEPCDIAFVLLDALPIQAFES